ncbi:MAG: prephenate dehydrogenase/arogenate dehydrogenase family protein [Phascolarctobacterium sp.]|nr:prephenate dehydrogenase/arogenate dehydrogenase family protein [Phascolarctobacterium sp.]
MIIIFKENASGSEIQGLRQELETSGFRIDDSRGSETHLFGIVGNTRELDERKFMRLPFVERVVRVTPVSKAGNKTREFGKLSYAIIGLGLMGGSYAKALRNLGAKHIIGVDRDAKTLALAKSEGVIDIGITSADATLSQADVIICCIYPEAIVGFIRDNVEYFKADALVTDIAGIKGNLISEVQPLMGPRMEFISGHPMAGKQANGYAVSDAVIFQNSNYIIVPEAGNSEAACTWLEEFARAIGAKHTVRVSPEEHDEIIAFTSDLPHVLAVSLIGSQSYNDKTKYFVAGSFKDGTRVADINPDLWSNLFISNKEKVAQEVDKLIAQLEKWREALRNGDAEAMKELMRTGRDRRKELY